MHACIIFVPRKWLILVVRLDDMAQQDVLKQINKAQHPCRPLVARENELRTKKCVYNDNLSGCCFSEASGCVTRPTESQPDQVPVANPSNSESERQPHPFWVGLDRNFANGWILIGRL